VLLRTSGSHRIFGFGCGAKRFCILLCIFARDIPEEVSRGDAEKRPVMRFPHKGTKAILDALIERVCFAIHDLLALGGTDHDTVERARFKFTTIVRRFFRNYGFCKEYSCCIGT